MTDAPAIDWLTCYLIAQGRVQPVDGVWVMGWWVIPTFVGEGI